MDVYMYTRKCNCMCKYIYIEKLYIDILYVTYANRMCIAKYVFLYKYIIVCRTKLFVIPFRVNSSFCGNRKNNKY